MSRGKVFSAHAADMLEERRLDEAWVWRVIDSPQDKWLGSDDNMHYVAPIEERGNRILHVVVNENRTPNVIVTQFFDRRLRRKSDATED